MSIRLDPDSVGAASYQHMSAHLTGPFAAGSVGNEVPIDFAGQVQLTWSTRDPLLLIGLRASLGAEQIQVAATLPTDTTRSQPVALFSPFSEAGSSLPLYLPPAAPDTHSAGPVTIPLSVTRMLADGTSQPVAAANVASLLVATVVEGIMGRVIYLLGAEKQRIRRERRELLAMRQLAFARDDALDQQGADLGVPRFAETLAYVNGEVVTQNRREPDAEYRRRLEIYRRFRASTLREVREALNGPGDQTQPNTGLLGQMGVTARFQVLDTPTPFAVAIHMFGVGDNSRDEFLKAIRQTRLVLPMDDATANSIHQSRFWPQEAKDAVNALRARLRQHFSFSEAEPALAPRLAETLDLVGKVAAALGVTLPWTVIRTQDDLAGSRYELGLGADLTPLTPAQLTDLQKKVADPKRAPISDVQIEAIVRSMQPQAPDADPEGAWFLSACGMRTVHRVNTTTLYVSHLPTQGLTISGPAFASPGPAQTFEAYYHAPGDPGPNLVLQQGLQQALSAWTASGGSAWNTLSSADLKTRLDNLPALAANDTALLNFRAAGLPAITQAPVIVQRLERLPAELLGAITMDATLAGRIRTQPNATAELQRIAALLQAHGLASVLPLVTQQNEIMLVVSVIGLPEAGLNLNEQRATGFRWYHITLHGHGMQMAPLVGARTQVSGGIGLHALIVIGYARHGQPDPYTYQVDLPDKTTLNLLEYEFLMNLLEQCFPIGVQINTFAIRQQHVALAGDGVVTPLRPSVARTFRPFYRRRQQLLNSQF